MIETTARLDDCADAVAAAALLAVDPHGLGGVVLRGSGGPVRDAWLELFRDLLPAGAPVRRSPITIADDRLIGGLDLPASLAAGRPVAQRGLLAEADGGVLVLPMAERLSDGAGARFSAVLDEGEVIVERDGIGTRSPARLGLVLLDEGMTPEERPPTALSERCAFRLLSDDVPLLDLATDLDRGTIAEARSRYARGAVMPEVLVEALCAATEAFGIGSARAALLAVRAARAAAALEGREQIGPDDVALAVRLVLAHRATRLPPPPEEPSEPDQPPDEPPPSSEESPSDTPPPEPTDAPPLDMLVEAARAALPDGLIADLARQARARSGRVSGSGDGANILSPHRGRPISARSGDLRPGERLNLVETLRAAAPWQALRRRDDSKRQLIEVRKSDFRIRRFVEQRESTTLFVVDASGSAAFQRLAEAKGAVELLLAEAYVSRARVALVSFRKDSADLVLPPTRSLPRARRELADLTGGGGTPLALGIETALLVALSERAKGRTPFLIFLTDGRANVTRDGQPGRAQAEADALDAARRVRAAGLAAVHIDTSPRPLPDADRFAIAMGAKYAALPYLDARAVLGIAQAHAPTVD